MNIYVGNLSLETTEDELHQLTPVMQVRNQYFFKELNEFRKL